MHLKSIFWEHPHRVFDNLSGLSYSERRIPSQVLRNGVPQAFLAEPLLRKKTVAVLVGAVGQHRDHVAARGKRLGHPQAPTGRSRRWCRRQNALGVDQAEQHGDGRLVRHLDGVVDQVVVGAQVGGHTALADTFGERKSRRRGRRFGHQT